jgi:MerR family transcriptional regulator, copper efflux regulator
MRRDRTPKPEMATARSQGLLNIGEAAAASGVSAKSIRHYEQIGLIPPANRSFANYRLYSQKELHTLRFIKSARALGFSIAKIGQLLNLWQDQQRNSADVKQVALEHVAELDAQIKELQSMRDTLASLAHSCHGDHRPDCPILEGLIGNSGTASCH